MNDNLNPGRVNVLETLRSIPGKDGKSIKNIVVGVNNTLNITLDDDSIITTEPLAVSGAGSSIQSAVFDAQNRLVITSTDNTSVVTEPLPISDAVSVERTGYTLATRPSAYNVAEGTVIDVIDLPIGRQQKQIGGHWVTLHKPWILDTDWWTDVDDAVAMRLVAYFEKIGLIDLLGITINTNLTKGPGALEAFMLAEGRDATALGSPNTPHTPSGSSPSYQPRMYDNMRRFYSNPASTENAVNMLRRMLANSTEKVDIVAIGYMNNLSELLDSPADGWSPLTGEELVAEKCNVLWAMAGAWPNGSENNFTRTAQSRAAGATLCSRWPTPIIFSGFEVGSTIFTGQVLEIDYPDDHLRNALLDYGSYNISQKGRPSWDPMKVYLAAIGDNGNTGVPNIYASGYRLVRGTATVDPTTGSNTWVTNTTGKHYYTIKEIPDVTFRDNINAMLLPDQKPAYPATRTPALPGAAPAVPQMPTVPVIPTAPGTLIGLSVDHGETTATLNWVGTPTATSYLVEYGTESIVAITNTITLNNLIQNTAYTVVVTPINDVGSGQSASITFTTDVAITEVPGSIINLTATETHNSIVFDWDDSLNANDYTYTLNSELPVTTASSTATISNLLAETSYTFDVFASNAVGDSAVSTITVTTLAAPVVSNEVVDQINLVEWFNADDLVGVDGTSIESWTSSSGMVLSQATVGNQPVIETAGGLRGARFDGANDRLNGSVAITPDVEMNIYAKIWMDSIPTLNKTIICTDTGSSSTRSWHLKITSSTNAQFVSFGAGGTNGYAADKVGALSTGQWVIIHGNRTALTLQAGVDGVVGDVIATPSANSNGVTVIMGGRGNNTELFNGIVNSVRVYRGVHDQTIRDQVIAQLLQS